MQSYEYQKRLFYDLAEAVDHRASGSVRFVGIEVNGGCELGRNSYYDVVEDNSSALSAASDLNDLLVGNAESCSVFGSGVKMSFCDDHALCDLDFTARTNELASGSSCDVTRFSDNALNADISCIGSRKLHLICVSARSEDGYTCELTLGSYYGYLLLGSELSGLREVFFLSKGCAFAEQYFEGLLSNVRMASRGFDQYFHFILSPLLFLCFGLEKARL